MNAGDLLGEGCGVVLDIVGMVCWLSCVMLDVLGCLSKKGSIVFGVIRC